MMAYAGKELEGPPDVEGFVSVKHHLGQSLVMVYILATVVNSQHQAREYRRYVCWQPP